MAGIEETLRTLRDVQGVYGSFVIADTGALVARDLPSVFDGPLFAEAGPRITRLYETFVSGGDELDSCILRYSEHKLYLRRMTWGVIGILSAVAINMPALRMVANLVIRRIDPEVMPSMRAMPPPPMIASPSAPPLTARSPDPPVRSPAVADGDPAPPAPAPPKPHSEPRDSSPPAAASRHVRMYRGRPVVDD